MFGLFKKKQAPTFHPLHREAVAKAGSLLQLQLITCKSLEAYPRLIRSDFARGYMFGFVDGAIQAFGGPEPSESDLFALAVIAHGMALGGDVTLAEGFVRESVTRQGGKAFDDAQAYGGSEFFDFATGSIHQTRSLERFLHESSA